MWKYALSFALLLAFGALLLPRNEGTPRIAGLTPAEELKVKQTTLSQDMKLTDDLCRTQCSLELYRVLNQVEHQSAEAKLDGLKALQQEHPHMEKLILVSRGKSMDEGIQSGAAEFGDEKTKTTVQNELKLAKQKTDNGESYQSAPFQHNGATHFVIGVPSNDSDTALLGVVKQTILNEVENHQLKNLRIVTYPADNHYKIESVDAKTLQDVKVTHPEHNQGTSHYHVNQVVVRFKQDPSPAELAQIQSELGTSHYRKLGYTYVFESKQMEAKQMMDYFHKWNVDYAEPHFLYLTNSAAPDAVTNTDSAQAVSKNPAQAAIIRPNDALYQRYQWNLPLIDTELGWAISKGSKDIKVAIVDTGVDLNHPDLKDQLVSGFNVVNNDSPPSDDVGHGTHVAGVVGAIVNNNLGVAGMSWYNRIMPVKVLDQSGAGTTYSVAQGIIWATDHGAKVINMSLGNYADANFLHDAIRYAFDRDVVLIAASGNDNTATPGYPAAYPEVFAVAATDANKNKASFSNYGNYIDVAAPGVSIASTYPNNQYAALSGTSMASPHVTALAALIRSVNPNLKNTEVMQIMRETAQDIGATGKDPYFGHGLIDVVAALKRAESGKPAQSLQSPQNAAKPSYPDWTQRLWDRLRGK